jgi:hypothetical protein
MIGFIVIVIAGISFLVIAKNPIDQCKQLYTDIHENRKCDHKQSLVTRFFT